MRRRRKTHAKFDHGEPIRRPNLAPIAGVLLIPAVLAMASYRTPTHALMIDLPAPFPEMSPVYEGGVQRISVSSSGEPIVNGMVADPVQFARHLEWIAGQSVTDQVVFEPAADAPYGPSLQVLAALAERGLTRFPYFCFGGIERDYRFGKGDSAPRNELPRPPEPISSALAYSCSERFLPES